MISLISVVHHIPDYVGAIEDLVTNYLKVGGSSFTFQDPLYYPRMGKSRLYISKMSYYSWRVFQGSWLTGVGSLIRRNLHKWDVENPSDMAEYHVVRDGVDEQELVGLLDWEISGGQATSLLVQSRARAAISRRKAPSYQYVWNNCAE